MSYKIEIAMIGGYWRDLNEFLCDREDVNATDEPIDDLDAALRRIANVVETGAVLETHGGFRVWWIDPTPDRDPNPTRFLVVVLAASYGYLTQYQRVSLAKSSQAVGEFRRKYSDG